MPAAAAAARMDVSNSENNLTRMNSLITISAQLLIHCWLMRDSMESRERAARTMQRNSFRVIKIILFNAIMLLLLLLAIHLLTAHFT
jgi:hypothetical protein